MSTYFPDTAYSNDIFSAGQYQRAFHGVPVMTQSRTVLVIDDDPDIRELIAQTLIDEGFNVVTSGDGSEALTLVEQDPPALILLDLMMPKISGWQVMQALRASQRIANIPVIILSASRELNTAAAQLGAAAYLAKPFDLDTLINTVSTHTKFK